MDDLIVRKRLSQLVQTFFGYSSLREEQERIVLDLLAGQNVMGIFSTGYGKSLIYQVTGLYLKKRVLVITPLIALMNDQVRELESRGIGAVAIHSDMSAKEKESKLQRWLSEKSLFLFVTPERLAQPPFFKILTETEVCLVVVDEAHCIQRWGYDFRPQYQLVCQRLEPIRKGAPLLLLSATLSRQDEGEIVQSLGLENQMRIYRGQPLSAHIQLEVHPLSGSDNKLKQLLQIRECCEEDAQQQGAILVYFRSIKELIQVEDALIFRGMRPLIYHGKLDPKTKMAQQAAFVAEKAPVMLATNAFGMGINKNNIRYVIHWQLPLYLEEYIQEVGRAGRDEKPAYGVILYDKNDELLMEEFFLSQNPPWNFVRELQKELSEKKSCSIEELEKKYKLYREDTRVENTLNLFLQRELITIEMGQVKKITDEKFSKEDYFKKVEKQYRSTHLMLEYLRGNWGSAERRCRLALFLEEGRDGVVHN